MRRCKNQKFVTLETKDRVETVAASEVPGECKTASLRATQKRKTTVKKVQVESQNCKAHHVANKLDTPRPTWQTQEEKESPTKCNMRKEPKRAKPSKVNEPKPMPQRESLFKKRREASLNKPSHTTSTSSSSKPLPIKRKARKRSTVNKKIPKSPKWSFENPPPLPHDWNTWEPWEKEYWRNAWRDPKDIAEEDARIHALYVEKARKATRKEGKLLEPTKNNTSTSRSSFPESSPRLGASSPEEVLGMKLDCTKEQAAKQFRRLSLVFHPDKNSDPEAKEVFAQINSAYIKLKEQRNW